jgi:hypothetical protein
MDAILTFHQEGAVFITQSELTRLKKQGRLQQVNPVVIDSQVERRQMCEPKDLK